MRLVWNRHCGEECFPWSIWVRFLHWGGGIWKKSLLLPLRIGGCVCSQVRKKMVLKRFFQIAGYFMTTYPLSLLVIVLVLFLSLVQMPGSEAAPFVPYADKIVHIVLYLVLSGMLWAEFLRGACKKKSPVWHAWIGACLCPVLFGGLVELLQSWCTRTRTASWWDFWADVLGVTVASIAGWLFYRRRMKRDDAGDAGSR